MTDQTSNPFSGLFSSNEPNSNSEIKISTENQPKSKETLRLSNAIEDIFFVTINKNAEVSSKNQLIYLEELAESVTPQNWIDLDLLEQVLFERILLPEPQLSIIPQGLKKVDSVVCEKNVITYLFNSYINLQKYNGENFVNKITELLFRNMITAIQQPMLFEGQDLSSQIVDLFKDIANPCTDFIWKFTEEFLKDNDESVTLYSAFEPVLQIVHRDIARSTLLTLDSYVNTVLFIFTQKEPLALVLLDYCTPKNKQLGSEYANSIIGALLTLSILPKTNGEPYLYYDRPMEQANSAVENHLWLATSSIVHHLHKVFISLLKCSSIVKNRTLSWLSSCLSANVARGKLWNAHVPVELNPANMTTVSDGFMLNLSAVLLKLCIPFCSTPDDIKMLKVDPTYCAVTNEETESKGIHMLNMSEITCLLPPTAEGSENVQRVTATNYNFVTECFYLAHYSLDLGYRVAVDRLIRLNQDLQRIQRAYTDAMTQGSGSPELIETMKNRMEAEMQKYYSLRAALLETTFIQNLMRLHSSTSVWLTQVAIHLEAPPNTMAINWAPLTNIPVQFPLPETAPETLRCVPELIVENIVGYLSFLRRFSPRHLEEFGYDALAPILTMVLTFMGSAHRMRNPHLRARLAECLEAMLPRHKDEPEGLNPLGGFRRTTLFTNHPHRTEIVRNILDVFVGIEMTGQSVQFEQKFNYRRPMYIIMDYLWEMEEHSNCFISLAAEAEENMEAVNSPIFLRFVNLLMNDAVFLLDEALTNMALLRTMQTARESGEWDQLSPQEREQNVVQMQHTGMLARFDNILGKETTHTLRLLTSKTSTIFSHSTMVDRVAAMLNYFLLHLVGPKKKNLKVKDQKEYEFDPANTVLDICHIYVALGGSESFCLAISQDGRSYSPQLFSLAEDVLARIGGGSLISELRQVASRVSELASQQKADEEVLSEAPDEFLDPIMSTLMTDPVILPSSKQTVDRTTIARHILSDQTDPFNRSPLTMDQVIPNKELAEKIHAWIKERKQKKCS